MNMISNSSKLSKNVLFLVPFICLLSSGAFASDCINPPGGIGLDSAEANLQCVQIDWKKNDAEMNEIYRKLLGKLKDVPEQENYSRTQLVAAQRAWITFRDAECELQASLDGSAHQWIIVNQTACISDLTKKRKLALSHYLDQASEN